MIAIITKKLGEVDMKKFLLGSLIVAAFLLGIPSNSLANENIEEESSNVELIFPDEGAPIVSSEGEEYLGAPIINFDNEDTEKSISSRVIIPKYWKIESKTKVSGYSYGGWRNGPSGKGKARLTASNSNTTNRSVTATISGDYPVGKGKIGSSLGVSIGESKSYGVSYSIEIPAGKRQQIIFRPVYKSVKVKQRLYLLPAVKTDQIKTATVKYFSHWDYSFKTL